MQNITGKYLIDLGYKPNKHFSEAIELFDLNDFNSQEELKLHLNIFFATRRNKILPEPSNNPVLVNMTTSNQYEESNLNDVLKIAENIKTIPYVESVSILPDACPVGGDFTIPVGCVVKSSKLHPGFHSSDVCCSLYATKYSFLKSLAKEFLDVLHNTTHFGPCTHRSYNKEPILENIHLRMKKNIFLKDLIEESYKSFGTQGDGNHFASVGFDDDTNLWIVTHHGSRSLGAKFFKIALKKAENYVKENYYINRKFGKNWWFDANTDLGTSYIEALDIIKCWTKLNHWFIHHRVSSHFKVKPSDKIFTEHNFIFQRNGFFYHAKGSTPAYKRNGRNIQIIPLNMNESILLVNGTDNKNSLGFAPHGAGRNMSRREHKKLYEKGLIKDDLSNIDYRFFLGNADVSEFPSAYKNAKQVKNDIKLFNLAEIQTEIYPYGCIMAGE